jgi:hypothetical protein
MTWVGWLVVEPGARFAAAGSALGSVAAVPLLSAALAAGGAEDEAGCQAGKAECEGEARRGKEAPLEVGGRHSRSSSRSPRHSVAHVGGEMHGREGEAVLRTIYGERRVRRPKRIGRA